MSAASNTWTLLIDGDCMLCRRAAALLGRWDKGRRLAFVPYQDGAALERLPRIAPDALERAMHLVAPDGAITSGAAALPEVLRLVPGGAPLALLFRLPGVAWLAAALYGWTAANRRRLGCGHDSAAQG